jgi:uncharacterized protein (DUF1499 family)
MKASFTTFALAFLVTNAASAPLASKRVAPLDQVAAPNSITTWIKRDAAAAAPIDQAFAPDGADEWL